VASSEDRTTQKVTYQSLPYDDGAFHFDVTSTYGSPQFIGLRDFSVLPEIQSWWGWIFSGMEDSWQPYTDTNDELKLLTKEGALVVVGEGESTFKDVFSVQQVDSQTFVSIGIVNGLEVSQTIHLPNNDAEGVDKNIIDIEVNISNQRSEKISNIWIGTMDRMDDDEASRFTNASRPQFYVEEELVGTFGTMFSTSFLDLEDLEE
jgi:hypothetical protein